MSDVTKNHVKEEEKRDALYKFLEFKDITIEAVYMRGSIRSEEYH